MLAIHGAACDVSIPALAGRSVLPTQVAISSGDLLSISSGDPAAVSSGDPGRSVSAFVDTHASVLLSDPIPSRPCESALCTWKLGNPGSRTSPDGYGGSRGVRAARRSNSGTTSFQSAPPRRGRRGSQLRIGRVCIRFNPRPREGGDAGLRGRLARCQVSIRAPAKGATRRRVQPDQRQHVSIRAPAKGATWTWCLTGRGDRFQSAPPRRGRPRRGDRAGRPLVVSIRAPAKGAT